MKKKKIGKKEQMEKTDELIKLLKIVLFVTLVGLSIYILTATVTGEINFKKDEEFVSTESIQYDEIIAGEILNRTEKEYYVLIFDFEKDDRGVVKNSLYAFAFENILYTVDLSASINSSIVGEKNLDVTDISDLRVQDTTLLKIKDRKIIETVEGYKNIVEIFN